MNTFENIDEIQLWMLEKLFAEGELIKPRELQTLEICNVNLCLTNPRNRNTYNKVRKWKLPLAIGEFAWHLSGSNNLNFITHYAKQWKNFSNDGEIISNSCYGYRIFGKDNQGNSQWENLKKLLRQDPFSRRAVLDIYKSDNGKDYFTKDIACVSTAQFLIRHNRLDLIVTMRSNDLIWGLPYDIYLFTMLQELLSIELNVELGYYYHNVGSMHIYERHFKLAKEMLTDKTDNSIIEPAMQDVDSIETFLLYEKLIRTRNIKHDEVISVKINSYWKNMLIVLSEYTENIYNSKTQVLV